MIKLNEITIHFPEAVINLEGDISEYEGYKKFVDFLNNGKIEFDLRKLCSKEEGAFFLFVWAFELR